MRVATSGHRLRLASHVRACHSDDQVILLDLRHDKYLGIGAPESDALADRVEGWPRVSERTAAGAGPAAVNALVRRLVSQGLLTDAASERLPDVAVEEPASSLDFANAATDSRIGARRLGRFVHSAAVAALWMRWRSLQAIATAVAARRARLQGTSVDASSLDAMTNGVAAYDRLRPLVFTAHDRCLHDSLALVGFLATEGAFPRWVIGVKTRPFGAHSWVQSGGTVLNDQHENVRRFRPILVV
jgi:hypothetical protein